MRLRNHMADSGPGPSGLWVALVASLVLHVVLITTRLASDAMTSPDDSAKAPIEITELPPEVMRQLEAPKARPKPVNPREKQMAETEDADNKEIDPNAKFLSDRNQKAEQQTRAKSIDDFRKAEGTGGKGQATEQKQWIPPTEQAGRTEDTPDDRLADTEIPGITKPREKKQSGVKRDWKTLSLKDLSVGGDGSPTAATDDRLDGVAESNRTILSTREYRYFSYYHRIKELLRQYWKPMVEQKLVKVWARGRVVSSDELTTQLLVLLDRNGTIQKISRLSSSGFAELDEAAVESFRKAGPFPNPPDGIIEDDGFVRIRWDFILKTESAPRIQFQSAGAAGGSGPLDR